MIVGGVVQCIGVDTSGQLGDGEPAMTIALESAQPIDDGAQLVDAGYLHTCAVLDDGSMKCWGDNASGRLGLGDISARGDGPGEMGDGLPIVKFFSDIW